MKKIIIVLALAFNFSYALDPMYNYRYTLGPEIVVPDAFFVSAGVWTRYTNDLYLAFNTQIGLTDRFEIGAKYIGGYEKGNLSSLFDLGAKFAISRNLAIQADIPYDKEWGGVLSISQWDGYTKNVSFIHEGRLGFLGAAGENRNVKISYAYFPYFQIGNAFRISAGPLFSFADYLKDFMADIMPRVEFGIFHLRFMGEVAIGILPWKAEKHNRYALFIATDI